MKRIAASHVVFVAFILCPFAFAEDRQAEEQRTAAFFKGIPHEIALPEKELKTYLIDATTYKVVRSFEGVFRDYWDDLDIVLTETEKTVYFKDGKEYDTPQKENNIFLDGIDSAERVTLTLWNRKTGEKIRSVDGERAFHGGDDSPIRLIGRHALLWKWQSKSTEVHDLETGKTAQVLPGSVRYLSPESPIVFVSRGGGDIEGWDTQLWQRRFTMPGGNFRLNDRHTKAVIWNNEFDWGRNDVDTIVYDLVAGKKIRTFSLSARQATLNESGDRVFIRNSYGTQISLWDVASGENLWTVPFDGKDNYRFKFSEDGTKIHGECRLTLPETRGSEYPRSYFWDATTGREIMKQDCSNIINIDGTDCFVANPKYRYSLYSSETGGLLCELEGKWIAAFPDGSHFLTGDEKSFYLWKSDTGELVRKIDHGRKFDDGISYDAESHHLRAAFKHKGIDALFDRHVTLWDVRTGETVREFDQPGQSYGDTVWKTDDTNAVFWNVKTKKPFFHIRLTDVRDEWGTNVIGPIRSFPAAGKFSIRQNCARGCSVSCFNPHPEFQCPDLHCTGKS